MKQPSLTERFPMTRREFIDRSGKGGLGLLAFGGFIPSFLARAAAAQAPIPEKDRTILVLIQLAGGNDGLNTIIPRHNDVYHNLRPTLAIREGLLDLDDQLSLHPSCNALHRLFNDGQLGILQNVGYPNPNRSHFRSSEIWETASDSEVISSSGWLGRYFDNTCQGSPAADQRAESTSSPRAVHVGDVVPQALHGRESHSVFGLRPRGRFGSGGNAHVNAAYERLLTTPSGNEQTAFLQHTMMNVLVTEQRIQQAIEKDRTQVRYPNNSLAQSLKRIAALIHSDLETRVYFVSQGGYDTHANQLNAHARLLGDLSDAMAAFQQDLKAKGRSDQVLTLTFSEFGRRSAENAGAGTDHGAAAPLFVMGDAVLGGLHGTAPIISPDARDIPYTTDFRSIYASILEEWFAVNSTDVLGQKFAKIPFI